MKYTFHLNKGIGLAIWSTQHLCYDLDDLERFCDSQLQMVDVYSIYVFDDKGAFFGEMKRSIKTEWKDA